MNRFFLMLIITFCLGFHSSVTAEQFYSMNFAFDSAKENWTCSDEKNENLHLKCYCPKEDSLEMEFLSLVRLTCSFPSSWFINLDIFTDGMLDILCGMFVGEDSDEKIDKVETKVIKRVENYSLVEFKGYHKNEPIMYGFGHFILYHDTYYFIAYTSGDLETETQMKKKWLPIITNITMK